MKLIAKKPCSFGGEKFYIGDEIPESLVTDAGRQEKLGVISIVNDGAEASDSQSDAFFTQEQVDAMMEETVKNAVDEAVNNTIAEMEQMHLQKQEELQQSIAELKEFNPETYDGKIDIAVMGESDGENAQASVVSATQEEIQQVFNIMQMNAEEGAKAVAEVASENVLILLHAADSRKGIKTAAKKQADVLFADADSGKADGSNEDVGSTEGADA